MCVDGRKSERGREGEGGREREKVRMPSHLARHDVTGKSDRERDREQGNSTRAEGRGWK